MATELPLPVSVLCRRARNAKSPKDRHDTAYFAWEVSIRLALAAKPPSDVTRLARGSVGTWVGALTLPKTILVTAPLLAAAGLFSEVGRGKRATPQSVTPTILLEALPSYRNRTIGHGSTREAAFYDEAAEVLLDGLRAAWSEHVFLPEGSRLLYAEHVESEPDGRRRARLLELTGAAGRVVDPLGTAGVPTSILPQQLCLEANGQYRSIYPWVLFRQEQFHERVFFFNGLGRRAEVLDYASGEALRGRALEEAFPGVEADLLALFHQQRVEEEASSDEDPDHLGGYRLLGKLGEGGMGQVYLAEQESLGRLVALKLLPTDLREDAVALTRFRREVAALSRCDHPNVIKILASGAAEGVPFYAMEYVEGCDLSRVAKVLGTSQDFQAAVSTASERLRETRSEFLERLPAVPHVPSKGIGGRPRDRYRQLAAAFRDAARGVGHLHEAGIVHRDLKPGNLMVTAADHRVVVMDLGLAMVSDASRSITRDKSRVLGTLRYMPPEQLQRNFLQVDRRADIYALGATFYELLTEKHLFDGDTEARLIEQVLREQPVPPEKANPRIPADLATIVRKATEKDPGLRYETAEALAEDVEAFLDGRPIAARPPTLWYLLKLAVRRNRALAATVAAALLLGLSSTALFVLWLDRARREATSERDAKAQALLSVERERSAKAQALDDVFRLADVKEVHDLLAEAEDLWPIEPGRARAMAQWLERARAVRTKGAVHRDHLARVRARGTPQRTGSGAEASEGWQFADPKDAWVHDVLEDLLGGLEQLAAHLPRIERRHQTASTLQKRSIDDQAGPWRATIEAIAASERYGGLRICPQVGLVPLGPDPDSGLHEFGHLGSGLLPRRDPKTKRLPLRNDMAIVLVLIPGGMFHMGAQKTDEAAPNYDLGVDPDEGPVHEVTLSPYFMAKYECTRAQWEALTEGLRPSQAGRYDKSGRVRTPRNPVEYVSWKDCRLWLPRSRLDLPTEARWEYACRAGTSTPWHTGAEAASLNGFANIDDAYSYRLAVGQPVKEQYTLEVDDGYYIHAPVGTYRPNAFGLYDMHGNVWEWCRDVYAPYTAGPDTDPLIEEGGSGDRTHRGGAWARPAQRARSADRGAFTATYRYPVLGVRPSRDLTPSASD